jgi:hypothetical protein
MLHYFNGTYKRYFTPGVLNIVTSLGQKPETVASLQLWGTKGCFYRRNNNRWVNYAICILRALIPICNGVQGGESKSPNVFESVMDEISDEFLDTKLLKEQLCLHL